MPQHINPFHDLYLTEAIGAEKFVKLFSPVFVNHGLALYQPGNVVLKGLQGSGKTMLLNLLKPDVRLAYKKSNERFPVPKEFRRFIGAGINLRKSGVSAFSQIIDVDDNNKFVQETALRFADFLNYWIIDDLFQTLEDLWESGNTEIFDEIGITHDRVKLDKFVKTISRDECWNGYFIGVNTYVEFREKVRTRIRLYRQYININIDDLPEDIKTTKTVIGEPISRVTALLRSHYIIDDDVQVYVRIDQYEELPTLDFSGSGLGLMCQELIHKALAARDLNVSYRIGVRQYAWPSSPKIYNTNGFLEIKRDYSVISIDDTLRRRENSRTWIFPDFSEDIFRRRMALTNYDISECKVKLLSEVFGNGLAPNEKAERYVKDLVSRENILKIDNNWPEEWISFLKKLSRVNPFSAKLAESWVRQKRGKDKQKVMYELPDVDSYPWEIKKYWKKERTEQALLQLASRNRQQLIWAGVQDVIGLSGGNILLFLFICQHIWDAWIRDNRSFSNEQTKTLPQINVSVQTMGLMDASEEWAKKPSEGEFSSIRLRLINTLGEHFYNELTNDISMSYPGRNGFSLKIKDIESNKDIERLLNTSVEYGDLYDAPHTSKSKGEKRRKFYIAPILCPAHKIPYKHTKEPEYINIDQLNKWLGRDVIESDSTIKKKNNINNSKQGSLFNEGE